MVGRGWFADALQRIGFKGHVSPDAEAELDAHGCKALKEAICRLGSTDVFTQEELATFRRLEGEGRALFGRELAKTVDAAALTDDPRGAVDYAHEMASQQRKTLDRMQKRCEVLGRQQQHFATLGEQVHQEARLLREAADERESALNRHYTSAAAALQANEHQCLSTAASLSSGTLKSTLLFSFCDTSELDEGLNVLTKLTQSLHQDSFNKVDTTGEWEASCQEAKRIGDAHLVSLFSLACAHSEKASSEAELSFLQGIASGGNPAVEVDAEKLREDIRAVQAGVEARRAEVKSKSRALLVALRDNGAALGADSEHHLTSNFAEHALEVQSEVIKEEIRVLDDVLYFQRQLYAVGALSRGWLDREEAGAASLQDSATLATSSLRAHADLGNRVLVASSAAPSGKAANLKTQLLNAFNPAHPVSESLGGVPTSLVCAF